MDVEGVEAEPEDLSFIQARTRRIGEQHSHYTVFIFTFRDLSIGSRTRSRTSLHLFAESYEICARRCTNKCLMQLEAYRYLTTLSENC